MSAHRVPAPLRRLLAVCIACVATPSAIAHAADYHVDALAGDDAATGLSEASAWRTVGPLARVTLRPGDRVLFRRGGVYDTANARFGTDRWDPGLWLQADASGTAAARITLGAYGDGDAPSIGNGRGTEGSSALTLRGAFVTVEGLAFRQVHDAAIVIEETATDVRVEACEFDHVGVGVTVYGARAVITRSHFHDGTMVRNTMGGDDDYGANGLVVSGPDVEISYNHAERLAAPSFDFGTDGGFVELYGAVANVSVHHNDVRDSNGFCEGGSSGGRSQTDLTFAYNVSLDNGALYTLHNGGDGFAAVYERVLFAQNTVVNRTGRGALGWTSQDVAAGTITLRNNILATAGGRMFTRPGALAHDHNLFAPGGTPGLALDASERVADAGFVDLAAGDVHLGPASPALDVGALPSLFASDLEGTPAPSGAGLDLGALERAEAALDGGPLGADAGAPSDASAALDAATDVDAGDALDASASPDATLDRDASDPDDAGLAPAPPSSGCACSVAGASTRRRAAPLVAALGLALGLASAARARGRARRVTRRPPRGA